MSGIRNTPSARLSAMRSLTVRSRRSGRDRRPHGVRPDRTGHEHLRPQLRPQHLRRSSDARQAGRRQHRRPGDRRRPCLCDRGPEDISGSFSTRPSASTSRLPTFPPSRRGVISKRAETQVAEKYREAINIRTPSVFQKVVNLSGGNQQKVVLSKWLFAGPTC
jgi:ABC-type dipeptide/oligopeptide/nickel transport system ATPase subunit